MVTGLSPERIEAIENMINLIFPGAEKALDEITYKIINNIANVLEKLLTKVG